MGETALVIFPEIELAILLKQIRRQHGLTGPEGDFALHLVEALDAKVSEFMNHRPQAIHLEAMAAEALEVMENRHRMRTVLPVVDEQGIFCGVIRHHELFRQL